MSGRDHTVGALCAVLSALGFAGKAVFIKVIYAKAHVDALSLMALRMVYAAPFFSYLGWQAWRREGQRPIAKHDWRWLSLMAFLGYYFSSLLDFMGLEYISAALERIILFTYPTWVLLISAAFWKKPITGRDVAALLLSTAGIALTFWSDLQFAGEPHALWTGAALVLGASVVYSFYLILSPDVIARVGSARFTPAVALIATGMVLGHFFATRPVAMLNQPLPIALLCLCLAVFSTVLPILLIVQALKRVTPSTVAIASSVGPILTIAMGAVFLGEPVTFTQVLGAAFVLAGVGWISRPPTVEAE